MIDSQLRMEMPLQNYETWVRSLKPLGFRDEATYCIGAVNSYGRDWVESRLSTTIKRLLQPFYGEQIAVQFQLIQEA